jgi:hypothetical protein
MRRQAGPIKRRRQAPAFSEWQEIAANWPEKTGAACAQVPMNFGASAGMQGGSRALRPHARAPRRSNRQPPRPCRPSSSTRRGRAAERALCGELAPRAKEDSMTADAGLKVTCVSCGKSFHVKPSRLKNGSRPRFCSIACRTFARNPVRAQRLYPAETADKHRLLPRGRIERSGQIQNGDLKRGA